MPTPNVPPDAAIARFRGDLEAITGLIGSARIGVAVSGGADSLGMLLLAQAAYPGQVEAATVDHRLRPAAAQEAAYVAQICAARGIPHATLTVTVPRRGNVSDRARVARYAALGDWSARRGLSWVLTAHHADDQLETIIMRLNRGSGIAGLSGIRARQGNVARPLLLWRRSELAALVASAGLTAIEDPSNRDDRFDRARLRAVLNSVDWLDPIAFAHSAAHLADAEDALDWMVGRWRRKAEGDPPKLIVEKLRDLPWELRRRTLIDCLRAIDPAIAPRADQLRRLDRTLAQGKMAMLGTVLCTPRDDVIRFEAAPPRRATKA